MKPSVTRFAAWICAALCGWLLAGCHSAREFEYQGAKLDTVNAVSIDNRTPYPLERDTWRLGPTRQAFVDGEEIFLGASEDGSTIMFKVAFYAVGKKSKLVKQSTERSTKALTALTKDLRQAGFIVTKRIAIVDSANVIGYKIGGPARIVGFYLMSEPGAYDALLPILDEKAAEYAAAQMVDEEATSSDGNDTEPDEATAASSMGDTSAEHIDHAVEE